VCVHGALPEYMELSQAFPACPAYIGKRKERKRKKRKEGGKKEERRNKEEKKKKKGKKGENKQRKEFLLIQIFLFLKGQYF
jgi:hypothetical protein